MPENAKVGDDGVYRQDWKRRQVNGKVTTGFDVWKWPDFRALCDRLGVDASLPTSGITLVFEMDEMPKIIQIYQGGDMNESRPVTDELVTVETTTLHNNQFRTHETVKDT